MSFGTAFNVASNVYGLYTSSKAAKNAAQWMKYNAALQRDARQLQGNLFQIGFDSQERARAQEYQRYLDEMAFFEENRFNQEEIQRYLRQQDESAEQFFQDQNQLIRERQKMLDRAAREKRIFELEQIAENKRIRKEERALALQELERERRIRAREREEERAAMTDSQARLDREFLAREERLLEDRERRQQEREREVAIADDILSQTARTRDNLTNIIEEAGNLQQPDLAGGEEIGARADEKFAALNAAIEREIDALLSKEEANAIRRGVGASGADNTARQAEILARMAPTLQSAAQKSYADALSEVSAENKIKTDRFNLLRQALADRLSNETLAGTTGLNLDTRLRQATSGVYDRDIGSAFNSGLSRGPTLSNTGVSGPLSISSLAQIYNTPSSGVGALQAMTNPFSGRTNYNPLSGLRLPGQQNTPIDISNFINMANTQYEQAGQGISAAQTAGAQAGKIGGQYLADALGGFANILDNKFGGTYDDAGNYSGGSPFYNKLFGYGSG